LKCYFRELQRALGVVLEETPSSTQGEMPDKYALALQLCFAQQQVVPDMCDSFYSHVASLFLINGDMLKLLMDNLLFSGQQLAGSALLSQSAQRIKGADASQPRKVVPGEHRANCQWETLLSETLEGSALTVPPAIITEAMSNGDDSDNATANQKNCSCSQVSPSLEASVV